MTTKSMSKLRISYKLKILVKLLVLRTKKILIYIRVFLILFKISDTVANNVYNLPCRPITKYFILWPITRYFILWPL